MDKKQIGNRDKTNNRMSNEKTNEDFNKQKPNPNDPNQNKIPKVGEDNDDLQKQQEESPNMGGGSNTGK